MAKQVNKVIFNGQTIMDVSDATATEEDISEGKTAYGANGEKLLGTRGASVISSFERIVSNGVVTGATGNIALPYSNDGHTAIVSPHVSGHNTFLRAWVSSSNGGWFLTAIDPNTGATINNTPLNIRYWVITS